MPLTWVATPRVPESCGFPWHQTQRQLIPEVGGVTHTTCSGTQSHPPSLHRLPLALGSPSWSSPTVSSCHLPSMSVCIQISPFDKDACHIGLGPTLIDLVLTCLLLQRPYFQILGYWGLGLQPKLEGRNTIKFITQCLSSKGRPSSRRRPPRGLASSKYQLLPRASAGCR